MKKTAWLLMGLLAMTLAGCSSSSAIPVRLHDTDTKVNAPAGREDASTPFRVAVSSIMSPVETLNGYEPLLKYLENRLARPVVLLQRRTYQEVNQLLAEERVDLAFVCSGGYTAGRGMDLLAMPEVKGQLTYQSYIIARSTLGAKKLQDLQGSSFAFTDPLSFSGYMAPVYMLLSGGVNPQSFFQRTFFSFSHDNSIRSVADGIVDAAAVDSMIYDRVMENHPEWRDRTRIVEKSLSVGNPPIVVPHGMDAALRQAILVLLLQMNQSPEGREALRRLGYDRFVVADGSLYMPLVPMWQKVQGLL